MSAAGDAVLAKATALVQRSEHLRQLLRKVLDVADDGLYDPVSDRHSVTLPGGLVRTIRQALNPESGSDQP